MQFLEVICFVDFSLLWGLFAELNPNKTPAFSVQSNSFYSMGVSAARVKVILLLYKNLVQVNSRLVWGVCALF